MDYEKCVRDGLVAVLISPGFGAGWSTWARDELKAFCLFDKRLVACVEAKGDVGECAQAILGDDVYLFTGGADDVVIHWIPVGDRFTVEEYDGFESLRTRDDLQFEA